MEFFRAHCYDPRLLKAGAIENPTSRVGGPQSKKAGKGRGGGNEKRYRRALVLACLDILAPTVSCMSLIRCKPPRYNCISSSRAEHVVQDRHVLVSIYRICTSTRLNHGALPCNCRGLDLPELRHNDRSRRDLVENESKTSLRSAVVNALLEYRRTCSKTDADALQVGMGIGRPYFW